MSKLSSEYGVGYAILAQIKSTSSILEPTPVDQVEASKEDEIVGRLQNRMSQEKPQTERKIPFRVD